MSDLMSLVDYLYVYCTDFIINLANILGLSYYEVNILIFCLGYPLVIMGLLLVYFVQTWRLVRIKKSL